MSGLAWPPLLAALLGCSTHGSGQERAAEPDSTGTLDLAFLVSSSDTVEKLRYTLSGSGADDRRSHRASTN
jgi:hypothetical protein